MCRAMLLANHDGEKAKEKPLFTTSVPKETRPPPQQQSTCHKTVETDSHTVRLYGPVTHYQGRPGRRTESLRWRPAKLA